MIKSKFKAPLMSIVMAAVIAIETTMSVTAMAVPDEINSVEDANKALLTDESLTTGTQENAREKEIDADEDIKEEIDASIDENWERIELKSAQDLLTFAKNCRLDTWSRNKYVVLSNDISLEEVEFKCIPTFGGVFDGQGHKITGYNLYADQSNIGLFSNIQETGIVKGLKVEGNVLIENSQSVIGGLCGHNYGVIIDCSFKGLVSATDYVGGIAGINELSGIIADSNSQGLISGEHFTGGICGENMGNILRCTNKSEVNTTERDVSFSLEDLSKITEYLDIFDLSGDDSKDKASNVNGIVDTGGIAGLSIGVIQHSANEGTIGYDQIGYNVGGIAGRQSGYIYDCINKGKILGRKDVGGIVGQAEPYVAANLTEDVIEKLKSGIEDLHDYLDVTLDNTDASSDTLTNRLNLINQFTDIALDDTDFLSGQTIDYLNGMSNTANEAISRVEYIIDETSKSGGAMDNTKDAVNDMRAASEKLIKTMEALNIYDYMTQEEREEYENYQNKLVDANKDYATWVEEATKTYTNYYRDKIRTRDWTNSKGDTHNYSSRTGSSPEYKESDVLFPIVSGTRQDSWSKTTYNPDVTGKASELTNYSSIYDDYKGVEGWQHTDGTDYPQTDSNGIYFERDKALEEDIADSNSDIRALTERYADNQYSAKYGGTYTTDVTKYSTEMASIISRHTDEMSSKTSDEANQAIDDVKKASNNMNSASDKTRATLREVRDRGSLNMPTLSNEYKAHATNLNNSLQGMSDNFELLNNELNSATNTMTDDLSKVNDQFIEIMNLYTDAMNNLLDGDMSNNIEDLSMEVAEVCTDATISGCRNEGDIKGAIDVSGIAGTMAVEYDFDLESDVTGGKESKTNVAYLTKCVLRDNSNSGVVTAEKNYASGICGLQEVGTILRCGNYASITSNSGQYVGGVAGSSLSNIVNSYAKCILTGSDYVGGIAGLADNIYDSYSLVSIKDADSFYGAIAGDVSSNGKIRSCFFVSDELAGIDMVSYSLKAEPVSMENIPDEFHRMKITFLLEDEEDDSDERNVIDVQEYNYGYRLTPDMYPILPTKDGEYTKWDLESAVDVYCDMEITATYTRNVTTLASELIRDNRQSAILVDGYFVEGDMFDAQITLNAPDTMDRCIEYWDVKVPTDGQSSHKFRYILPDDIRSEVKDSFAIYYRNNGEWVEVKDIETFGAYYVFEAPGERVLIQIVNEHTKSNMCLYIIIGCIVVVVIVILVLLLIKANKNKTVKKKDKKD